MIRVLLSLDLTNKESERDNFNNFLAEQQWKKLAGVNIVWAIEYDDFSQTNEQHVTNVKRDLSKVLLTAAREFKPDRITYVAQIANIECIGRYIYREGGDYKAFIYEPC